MEKTKKKNSSPSETAVERGREGASAPPMAAAASSSSSSSLLRLRHKPQTLTLNLRLFSSSPRPPPPTSDPPEAPPSSDPLSEIKSRLRHPSSAAEPRRIPLNPPKPDLLSSTPSPSSLGEILRHVEGFRRRSSPPSPSLQDLDRDSLLQREGKPDEKEEQQRPSFDAIRQSLRKLSSPFRDHKSGGLPSIRSLAAERLDVTPRDDTLLPRSIFGREMEREKGAEGKERKTDFLRMYSYEELGERLRALRPDGKAAAFSLEDLNDRLARLREEEDRESESRLGGISFRELRDSLLKLKDAETTKKTSNLSGMLIIGREATTRDHMLGPPKEHLVEKYFHPDLMSSAEKLKLELQCVRDEFKMSESDCGSARVQVAQLTTKIKHLSSVLHKKDKHSQKGLQAMVQRRKKLLKYLRRTDWDSYCFVLSKLGLRDAPDYRT